MSTFVFVPFPPAANPPPFVCYSLLHGILKNDLNRV